MPAVIGERSRAPRILSERLESPRRGTPQASARYLVSLEGLAGQTYAFRLGAPSSLAARDLVAETTVGGSVRLEPGNAGTVRMVHVTFPATGANADGYTATTVTFGGQGRP